MSSNSDNERKGFVNRDFTAAIHLRRCVELTTRPEELTPSNFLGYTLMPAAHKEKLKPFAAGQSNKSRRRP